MGYVAFGEDMQHGYLQQPALQRISGFLHPFKEGILMDAIARLFFWAALFVCAVAGTKPASAGPVLSPQTEPIAAAAAAGQKELQDKKRLLNETIVKMQEDIRLPEAINAWETMFGNNKYQWPTAIKQELYRRLQQKRSTEYKTNEKAGVVDDQGLAIELSLYNAQITWGLLAPALVGIGEIISIVPEAGDPVGLGIELVKLIGAKVGENDNVTEGNAKELLKKYEPKVGNLNKQQLLQLLADLKSRLNAEISAEIRQLQPPNQGPAARSASPSLGLVSFDASSGELSFSDDFIISVDGSLGDGIVGANVELPTFKFMGTTTWGYPYPFFAALESSSDIVKSGDPPVQLLTDVPALLFFPGQNVFTGVMPYFVNAFDTPGFAAGIVQGWESSAPLFPFISITPNIDFWDATNGFNQTSSSGYQNQLFLIGYRLPEPGVVFVFGSALGALWLTRRCPRRKDGVIVASGAVGTGRRGTHVDCRESR